LQSRNLEIGIEKKSLGVMNGLAGGGFFLEQNHLCFQEPILLLSAVSLRFASRMPLPSGLKISFCFHNNEREKTVVLERVIAGSEAIPSNLSIDFMNDFLKLK
jgi:hypothetical protein